MRFWLAALSALALFLCLSTGGTANAAVVPCTQEDVQLSHHPERAAEEPAGCPLSGTPHHHHASCSAHVGVAPASTGVEVGFHAATLAPGRYAASLSGRAPPSLLRPPIA